MSVCVSMYLCMSVCMSVCTCHVCMPMCIRCPCAWACLCACLCVCMCVCACPCAGSCVCRVHVHACVCVHTESELSPGPVNKSRILCHPSRFPHEGPEVWKSAPWVPEDVESAIACSHVRIREGFGKWIPGLSFSLSHSNKKGCPSFGILFYSHIRVEFRHILCYYS